MEKDELKPIISLLVENKLSDEGVENLCKSLNQESIIQIIKGVNEYGEEKLWWEEVRHFKRHVGSGRRYGMSSVVPWTIDHTKEGIWSHAFLYFLLCIVRDHPQFILDVFAKIPSSPKYFVIKTRHSNEIETLLRFRKEHLDNRLFEIFIQQLYSLENISKRNILSIIPPPELPSQTDKTNWD